ncbi:unnamed protein product [Closterium sp. NIES-65]|nr:unnamed protein product [Closterium sp. NIES-65]
MFPLVADAKHSALPLIPLAALASLSRPRSPSSPAFPLIARASPHHPRRPSPPSLPVVALASSSPVFRAPIRASARQTHFPVSTTLSPSTALPSSTALASVTALPLVALPLISSTPSPVVVPASQSTPPSPAHVRPYVPTNPLPFFPAFPFSLFLTPALLLSQTSRLNTHPPSAFPQLTLLCTTYHNPSRPIRPSFPSIDSSPPPSSLILPMLFPVFHNPLPFFLPPSLLLPPILCPPSSQPLPCFFPPPPPSRFLPRSALVTPTFCPTSHQGRGTRQVNPGDEMRGSMGESHMAGGAEGSERDMIAEGPARSQEQVEDGNDRGEEGQRGMDRGGGAEGDGQRGRDRGGGTEGEGQGGRDRGGEGLLPAFSHLPSPE